MQPYIDAIVAFVQANQAWAAPVAFLLAFGESLAFVSLFLPSTVILVAIGGLLGASGIDVWTVVIAAWIGGCLGYALLLLDRLLLQGRDPQHLAVPRLPADDGARRQVLRELRYLRRLPRPLLRPRARRDPVIAGMAAMPQLQFQIANVASAFLWAAGVIAPSFYGLKWLTHH